MGFRLVFYRALSFTKLSVYLACTWPPLSTATKWQIIRYNIRWCILFVNALCLFLGLIFSIYKHHEHPLVVTQSACFVGSTANLMIKMAAFRIRLKSTQARIEEMDDFVKITRPHERTILRRYLAKRATFHGFISVLNYLTASMVIFAPLLLRHQPMPTMAVYPFSLGSGVVRSLTYIHQGIAGYQCASGVTADCQAAVMMWFAGARIEMLAAEAKNILQVKGIPDFVEKHKKALAYAVDVSKSMRYVAVASSMASGLTAIMSSLLLISRMQFVPVAFIAAVNLFVCAWPADNLRNVCSLLGNSVYNIPWFEMPVSMKKDLLMIIRRCQRPIIVSVSGLLPTLSLQSYAAYLSAVYSYFTTLHVMTSDKPR